MAVDAFGNSMTTRAAYDATRKGGTCVVIGIAPEGSEAQIPMVDIVRNQKTIVGSYYGSASPHETFRTLVDFYRSGKLEIGGLALRRYALDEINEAYDDLERGADGRGVIVFEGVN